MELAAAAILAALILWMVLEPLLRTGPARVRAWEPPEPEETARGVALAALREIEFDRETGKLSEADYAELKTRYTREALAALRDDPSAVPAVPAASAPSAPSAPSDDLEAMIAARTRAILGAAAPPCEFCGPRPEPDAAWCSTCGRRLAA